MKPILEIQNISKRFSIQHQGQPYLSFREKITGLMKTREKHEDFWALRDVSFSLSSGDSFAIIGRNGAGKSTLLKILSRITPPSEGRIISRGRIASLLEVGTGFHQELTGRENIFMNGSILGMKKWEIEKHFEEIVDFSGTEKFLDTPLKHYSSGMQLRLAFSVAAFLQPEILIIDEVLAVGDAEFQKKCLGKMENVSKSGRTIIFVSHNLAAVATLCSSGMLLQQGQVKIIGPVGDVIKRYQEYFQTTTSSEWRRSKASTSPLYFESIRLDIVGDQPHMRLKLQTVLKSASRHNKAFLAIDITNSLGINIMQAIPEIEPFIPYSETGQQVTIDIALPPLVPDNYAVTVWLGPHNTETFDFVSNAISFEVNESPTKGRTFPHTLDHGSIVPVSSIIRHA